MKRPLAFVGGLAATAGLLAGTLVSAPFAGASSHREAPMIAGDPYADLTDVYAFAVSGARSVLIANVNPGAGALPNSTKYFGSGVQYYITVDTNGDATPDVSYLLRFGAPSGGSQSVSIWKNGHLWGSGTTGVFTVAVGALTGSRQ